jgi:hypothetical protein
LRGSTAKGEPGPDWFAPPLELNHYDIHPTMRRQIHDHVNGAPPHRDVVVVPAVIEARVARAV